MFTSIAGRVALVTGAGRGIGKGVARVLAAEGARVLLVARSQDEGPRAVAEIEAAGGVAAFLPADVTSRPSMQAAAQAAVDRFGGIDILCANAGIFPEARLDALTLAEWDQVLATNLTGSFLSVQACLPAMQAVGRGRIILISSITGPITAYPGWCHYAASKAGQLGFLKTAALELAPHHITINAVLPGNVATEGLHGMGEQYVRDMTDAIPMKQLGTVDDVAHACLFFASDEAGFITGQTLVVDGGQVLPESLQALQAI